MVKKRKSTSKKLKSGTQALKVNRKGKNKTAKTKPKLKSANSRKSSKTIAKPARKTKNNKTNNLQTYVSFAVILIVTIGYSSFYGVRIYKQGKIDNYKRSVYEIQIATNKKMAKLNPWFANFVVSPNVAKKLASKFKQASDTTRRAKLALSIIVAPKKYNSQHEKLIETYGKGSLLYSDLYNLSNYIVKRDKYLTSLIKDLKDFSDKVSKTRRTKEAVEVASSAETRLKKTINELKKLKSPIKVYDDKLLIKYVASLTKHLKEFQEAIAKRSRYRINLSLSEIQDDYAKNWQDAFLKTDREEIEKYNGRVKKIETAFEEVANI